MSEPIALARPSITETEIEAVVEVLRTPHLSLGSKLPAFENAFAKACGTREAVACSSGTAALHLTMLAGEIGPDDEVVTTPFSFVASANCALMVGAKPVFVDVDPNTWNIDPGRIEAAVTSRTRAILPVHVFGQVADMEPIARVARARGLLVIEDACEALGSRYQGKPAGSLGDAGVFGFYPNKQITTGEGGMIVTDDAEFAALCRSLRNQGRDAGNKWLLHARLGYNYRLSEVNCALGLAQLARLEEIIAARSAVRAMYCQRLEDDRRLWMQQVSPGIETSWFVFVVRLGDDYDQKDRDRLLGELEARGIGCSNYFAPIHLQPFYVERFRFRPGDFPVCEALSARTIALPFHHELTRADVDRVCDTLLGLL